MKQSDESATSLANGDADKEIGRLRQVLEQQPDNAEVRLDLARRMLESGDPAAAVAHLQRLVRSAPEVQDHVAWLGHALLATGDLRGARQCVAVLSGRRAEGAAFGRLVQRLRQAVPRQFGFLRLAADLVMPGLALDGTQPGILLRLDVAVPSGLHPARFESRLRPEIGIAFAAASAGLGVKEALADLLLRLAVGLQQAAGWPVFDPGSLLPDADARSLALRVPYVDAVAGRSAIRWAIETIDSSLQATDDPAGWDAELRRLRTQAPQFVEWMKRRASVTRNMAHFLRAAQTLGIPWRPYAAHVHQIGHGRHSRWIESSLTDATSYIGVAIAQNKMETAAVLRRAGVPVPDHARATTVEAAIEIAGRLGFPVVVKPVARDGGLGVAAGLEDEAALRQAFAATMADNDAVLVEKHVDGDDFRLVVMGGRVTWAIERIPGGVLGDGRSTLGALLAALNADPRRRPGEAASLVEVEWDEEARHLAARQGLAWDSVPAAGRFVRLRRITNVVRGGMPVAFPLERIHPANIRLAERATAALRLDLAGIDFITPDISRPWYEAGGAINEVNARPSLGLITAAHLFPDILKWAVGGGDGRIPIVAVVGDRDHGDFAAEVATRLHGRLCDRGLQAGLASGRGAWIGRELVTPAAMRGERGGALILADVAAEAAVLELPLADILTEGVPFDRCDVIIRLGAGGPPDPFEAGLLRRATRAVLVPPSGMARLSGVPGLPAVGSDVETHVEGAAELFADAAAALLAGNP